MKISFAVPMSGSWATPANMARIARRAEELGYHELWTFQRLLVPVDRSLAPVYQSVQDPVATLAYLAGLTERIRLGAAILNIPLASPAYYAKQLATLQHLAAGRLTAGFGLGWMPEEFAASGVPMEGRGRRAEEFLEVVRRLWTREVAEFDGDVYTLPASRQEPRPGPAPSMLLGGNADAALRRVGRLADGWISSSSADLRRIDARIALVKDAAREAGRDPSALRFVVRGVTRVRPGGDPGRAPLTGSYDEIRSDVAGLAAMGVTEVFHDLNFDEEIGSVEADPVVSMRRAEEALELLAPGTDGRVGR
ncbi:probable F420-dependent oxidoreductase, Rv2161c family [Sinosporangium album]|uniref:Probable F420-dependent oxidoreductase, Rv2161c family n=1 Tax=Sinosporangium album TaxID=504805 RepID=A0A1G8E0F2_9ACTN|nr:TIGR03619 family F420-dependent LLM class oxidoreductase [Sinosporangium album]SDH63452.1 probable F420-dependent oxidoreductase, Rv2161c family [Sinosporangium album]